MAQVLKEAVRDRILQAALEAFSKSGFAGATMSDIAQRAGMAVANLYRYFGNKDVLFEAAVPPGLALRFEDLLEKSARSHARVTDGSRASDTRAAEELLDFWIEHRLEAIILLDRSQGTLHAGFAERFVQRLLSVSVAEIRVAHPGVVISNETRLVLTQVFENTRRTLGALLESCTGESALRSAVACFRSYQVAGLMALAAWVAAQRRGS
jgi:AcrR family transcriptional regulator